MAFVVLQPNSLTNHSDKYRVVDHKDWAAFANKAVKTIAIAGEFDTYPEAVAERDRLNK